MLIHYIWIQGEECIPEKYLKNIEQTKLIWPDATIKIWSKKDIESLIFKYYPFLTNTIKNLKHWILLVDIGRMAILDREGGLYLDTDVFIKKRIRFRNRLFLVKSDIKTGGIDIRNWIIFSPKNHPFFIKYLKNLDLTRKSYHFWSYYVSDVTGSIYISRILKKYNIDYDCISECKISETYLNNDYDSTWHSVFLDDRDKQGIFFIITLLLLLIFLWLTIR